MYKNIDAHTRSISQSELTSGRCFWRTNGEIVYEIFIQYFQTMDFRKFLRIAFLPSNEYRKINETVEIKYVVHESVP